MFEWFERVKEDIINFITNRVSILTFLFFGMGIVLLYRCFDLQIVNGQKYLDDFILMTEKTRDISSSRGSIYDRNGELLAYDELAYSVKIEDIFESGRGKNKKLNDTIYRLIQSIEKNGDQIITDFDIILDQNNHRFFSFDGRPDQFRHIDPRQNFGCHNHIVRGFRIFFSRTENTVRNKCKISGGSGNLKTIFSDLFKELS